MNVVGLTNFQLAREEFGPEIAKQENKWLFYFDKCLFY